MRQHIEPVRVGKLFQQRGHRLSHCLRWSDVFWHRSTKTLRILVKTRGVDHDHGLADPRLFEQCREFLRQRKIIGAIRAGRRRRSHLGATHTMRIQEQQGPQAGARCIIGQRGQEGIRAHLSHAGAQALVHRPRRKAQKTVSAALTATHIIKKTRGMRQADAHTDAGFDVRVHTELVNNTA